MMKELMGQCLNQETALDHVWVKTKETEDELIGLKSWKVGMEKKLECSEKVKKEHEQHLETLRKVLQDKDKEIKDAKDQLRHTKEAVVHEYRDFDALLEELGVSYVDRFDDALRQAKKAYPDLDFSQFNIDA